MGEVLRTSQAHLDLVEIAEYLYRHDPAAADRILNAIEKKCNNLSDFPVGNYVLFYRPKPNGIEVIRILHGARDLPPLLGE